LAYGAAVRQGVEGQLEPDSDDDERERPDGVSVAGGQPAVGRATEVVRRDERRVRGVPQQVEEDETAPTACPPRSGLGGSVVSVAL
jgi:hypothetical protein